MSNKYNIFLYRVKSKVRIGVDLAIENSYVASIDNPMFVCKEWIAIGTYPSYFTGKDRYCVAATLASDSTEKTAANICDVLTSMLSGNIEIIESSCECVDTMEIESSKINEAVKLLANAVRCGLAI